MIAARRLAAMLLRSGAVLDEAHDPFGVERPAGKIQGAQTRLRRRRAAAQCDGQGAEGGAARGLQGHFSVEPAASKSSSRGPRAAARGTWRSRDRRALPWPLDRHASLAMTILSVSTLNLEGIRRSTPHARGQGLK